MRVAELMHQSLHTISIDATVADAVSALAAARVSALPVIDRSGRAVGVLSTRTVLAAEATQATPAAREGLFRTTRVLEIMEPWPPTTSPEADVRHAAQDMLRHVTQRLFVERSGALVGVLSQTDIVAALAAGRLAPVEAVAASGAA